MSQALDVDKRDDIAKLAHSDAEITQILQELGSGEFFDAADYLLVRQKADSFDHLVFDKLGAAKAELIETESDVPMRDGHKNPSALWSPFNANSAFDGLPPNFIQVCGKDIIRDDGLIYERTLRKRGIKTRLNVYPGVPHFFWAIMQEQQISEKFMVDVALGFAWLLAREIDVADAEKAMVFPQTQ